MHRGARHWQWLYVNACWISGWPWGWNKCNYFFQRIFYMSPNTNNQHNMTVARKELIWIRFQGKFLQQKCSKYKRLQRFKEVWKQYLSQTRKLISCLYERVFLPDTCTHRCYCNELSVWTVHQHHLFLSAKGQGSVYREVFNRFKNVLKCNKICIHTCYGQITCVFGEKNWFVIVKQKTWFPLPFHNRKQWMLRIKRYSVYMYTQIQVMISCVFTSNVPLSCPVSIKWSLNFHSKVTSTFDAYDDVEQGRNTVLLTRTSVSTGACSIRMSSAGVLKNNNWYHCLLWIMPRRKLWIHN